MSSLYPNSHQIPVMKYCSQPSQTMIDLAFSSGDWIMQEKVDGALYMVEKTIDGTVYMFSRTVSKITGELAEKSDNFPHIKKWAEDNLPNDTILIGELYVIGGHSNDVTKLSGCLPARAVARQFDSNEFGGPLHYYVFDIIYYDGEDLQNYRTIDRLNYLYTNLKDAFENQEYVELAPVFSNDFENHLNEIFARGGEGAVFKNKNCPYRAGKRTTTSQMFKWKQHLDSIDLVCTGVEEPVRPYTGKEIETWNYWLEQTEINDNGTVHWAPVEGQLYDAYTKNPHLYQPVTKPYFYNWKSALTLGAYKNGELIEIGRVASGLTDADRADMAENPQDWIGSVIEIECMSLNKKDYTIRHPVFIRRRDDKDPKDCILQEIFA